ncbi:hypothetical protein FGB62_320g017 [Gracilaria domingensis]|nr:hypothetical protein FGB62_320g017 [Gracilaria domingensis]
MAPSVVSSLRRNGAVLVRRDSDGNDGIMQGVVYDRRKVTIRNARTVSADSKPSLERNGFQLIHKSPTQDFNFLDNNEVVQHYYKECVRVVQKETGARYVAAFDHNVRSAGGKADEKRITGGQPVQDPVHIVHGDYTLHSAPERLERLTRLPGGNDTFRPLLEEGETLLPPELATKVKAGELRFAIVNVWRNIADEPVASHALTLCDARTVLPEELVVFEIHYQDRIGENYFAKHTDRHTWYTYPAMTPEEALLIKQWDSAGTLARSGGMHGDGSSNGPCSFSFHSAFEDAVPTPNAPERWSIEVRCIAIYT